MLLEVYRNGVGDKPFQFVKNTGCSLVWNSFILVPKRQPLSSPLFVITRASLAVVLALAEVALARHVSTNPFLFGDALNQCDRTGEEAL
jgi:hypothetical protein